ncbi:MAG: hypothetical protein K2N78_02130, partial [Oscillospiraceae bacterium]|nr:hypothetical protein [Oscillospiraceae bacterium]
MKHKRKPWPRWAKIVRNILLAILLACLTWDAWDRPTISAQAALRKKERQMLCPESTAAVEIKDMGRPSHWVVQPDGLAMVFQAAKGDFFTNLSLRCRP